MRETYGKPKEYYEIPRDVGDERTYKFLVKAIKDSIQEMYQNPDYVTIETNIESGLDPYVLFQFFYNNYTQKSFIQFNVYNHNKNSELNKKELENRITNKIYSQFKYDTRIDPEILNRSQKKIVPDNRMILTPYTIGYWRSLDQVYEVVEDKAQIYLDLKNLSNLPQKPTKNIADFSAIVKEICERYNLIVYVDKSIVNDYIADFYTILKETHGEDDYNERIAELNELYGVTPYDNTTIPAAMVEYATAYKDFFEKDLKKVIDDKEDDGKFDFGGVVNEYELAEGDYDFGDLTEGVDPDTVAVDDYDFYLKDVIRGVIVIRYNY